jgi:hypothetical protein
MITTAATTLFFAGRPAIPEGGRGVLGMALTKHNRMTVGDLRALKGKRQLTM